MKKYDATDETKSLQRRIRLFLTGLTMGLADLIPGVSSGTVAFLLGIYDELLYTIKLMTGQIPKLLFARKFKQAFSLIPFGFLLPLGIGMVVTLFGLVHLVTFFLDTQPVLVWSLFFGLVLGSVYIVSKRISTWTLRHVLFLLAGFICTFVIVGLPSLNGSESPLALFGTGVIAITAMILPGISGSLIMVLFGQYEIIINAVADRNILTLTIFATGAIIGLALFVRLLTWLLKQYHFVVIATLIGVMAGSLRRIWPWQTSDPSGNVSNILPIIDMSFLWALALMILGVVAVIILERIGITEEHSDIDTDDQQSESIGTSGVK